MAISQNLDQLGEWVASDRVSHAYAFVGTDNQAKMNAAKRLAQHLACPLFESDQQACLACDVCLRIEDDEVPDIIWLEPDGRYIRVDQMRELKQWTLVTPVELDFKMAIIQQADQMNTAASNALLQVLEEPALDVYFILLVDDEANLLPTIRSRVQTLYFKEPDLDQRIQHLEEAGVSPALHPYLSHMNLDLLIRLVEFVSADELGQYIQDVLAYYKLLILGDPMAFVGVQTQLKPYLTGDLSRTTADYLETINRDVLVYLETGADETSQYLTKMLSDISIQPTACIALHQALIEMKQSLQFNVPAQLAFEQVACKMIQSR